MSEIKYLFRARTTEGFLFKVLAELLQQNIKSCCINLSDEGMKIRMTDNLLKVLININLDSDKFNIYKFKYSSKQVIGINLSHLYKMLKSVKKKDIVELFIIDDNNFNFGIKVIPKDNSRETISFIKIQNIQNIEISLPTGYKNSVIIPSGEFHKMIKDMIQIGNLVEISTTQNTVTFQCMSEGIYSRQVKFGVEDEEDTNHIFKDVFRTEQLNKIIKISGLSNKLFIYTINDMPLLFKTNVGSIGSIEMYIKKNEE